MGLGAWLSMACCALAVAHAGPSWWQLSFVGLAAVFLAADPPE